MTGRTPQLPAVSGRLVFWEHVPPPEDRSWAQLFQNRLRRAESPGFTDSGQRDLLVEQAVFVATLAELRTAVEKHPASFVFAEVTTTHFRELLGQIPQLRRATPQLRIAVVCLELPRLLVDEYDVLDSLFREAGATAVLATQRDLLAMIPAVVTHFAALPQPETNWREAIEQRLPWRPDQGPGSRGPGIREQ